LRNTTLQYPNHGGSIVQRANAELLPEFGGYIFHAAQPLAAALLAAYQFKSLKRLQRSEAIERLERLERPQY
jgi:hypothetical protein